MESSEDHTGEGADKSGTERNVGKGAEAREGLESLTKGVQERQERVLMVLRWTDQSGRTP